MAKILFVDNKVSEFDRFQKLVFAREHANEIEHVRNPVGLASRIEDNDDIRLVILDILWEQDSESDESIELGASTMRELARANVNVPVVIYSVIEDDDALRRLIPEMMELGAFDWVSKDDNSAVRSFRFERAYKAGRGWHDRRPDTLAVLPHEADHRRGLHIAIMFADLSGFTALSDEVDRADVVSVLGHFYQMAGDVIRSNGGYVDKYIGDAVMAIFGLNSADDTRVHESANACIKAARAIISKAPAFRLETIEPALMKYRSRVSPSGFADIGRIRIGCESGVVDIVRFERGNGSEITAIGRAVNIAARILPKASPDEAWIGQNLQGLAIAADVGELREVEFKNLPGKFSIYKLRV